jgi:phosphoesterase RecJ-like protein
VTERQNAALKQASQLIRAAHQPLLVCHISPDGDAVGSLTGLGWALRQMDQQPILACADHIPSQFNYIPGAETIVQEVGQPFDLVISVDCADLGRLGRFSQLPEFGQRPLVNVDHHVTNPGFGTVNLVDPEASSSAEIVLRLLDAIQVTLSTEAATCLLAGIVSDTRGFRTETTTVEVVEAALRLMKAGVSLPTVAHHALDRRPTAAVLLWGAALAQLHIEDHVIWTGISQAMRRAAGYAGNGDAKLANFLVTADDADAIAVFTECDDGRVEVSLRAIPGFDVTPVAIQFGGGGHALAAGCTILGSLEKVQAGVVAALRADIARQRRSHQSG